MDSKEKSPAQVRGIQERGNSSKNISEGKKFLIQKKKVFKAFFGPPKSMLEVEFECGIMRSNICWYLAGLQKTKSIQRVFTGTCSITKMPVGKYSTNPMYWEKGVATK